MASINNADLQAYRNYVEQHRDAVFALTMTKAPSLQHFTMYPGVRGKDVLEWRDVEDLVKRWAAPFAPADDTLRRYPVIIENHFHKAELAIIPKLDFTHYKGTMMTTKMDPANYPFIAYWLNMASDKIAQQMEFQQIFTGDLDAGGNDAADMYNGLLTQIADDQALGSPVLTPVNTGALTAANIIDQMRAVDDAIDEKYRPQDMQFLVSPSVFKMYIRERQKVSGFHPDDNHAAQKGMIALDGVDSNIMLCSCPGMGNSQRIIATPKSNVWYAPFGENDTNIWQFETNHRQYDAWCDFRMGVGFMIFDPRILYINNQA